MEGPRGIKRNRDEAHCEGDQCGNLKCRSCWVLGDEDGIAKRGLLRSPQPKASKEPVGATDQNADRDLPPAASFADMVAELDQETVRRILIRLATVSPSAQSAIKTAYESEQLGGEGDIDFDKYSKRVWHILNTSDYTKKSSERDVSARAGAWGDIFIHITRIDKDTRPGSSFGTKQSALETLRKIMKSLLLSKGSLSQGVRAWLKFDDTIPKIMLRILHSMTTEQQIMSGSSADDKGTLLAKVKWVRDEAQKLGLNGLDDLDAVLELMGDESAMIKIEELG